MVGVRGGSRNFTAGGGVQVTNEAEGFTGREAPKGGGGHSLPQVGIREVSPGKFKDICIKMVHSECILM